MVIGGELLTSDVWKERILGASTEPPMVIGGEVPLRPTRISLSWLQRSRRW